MERSVIRPHTVAVTAAALLLPLALAGCRDRTAFASPNPPREVVVHAGDYSFHAPDTIPAGLTRIRFLNQGHEPHHLQLARLSEGHTVGDLLDAAAKGDLTPAWATYVGGPNVPRPGAPGEVAVNLAPGNYAMLCFIASRDGVRHFAKGMLRSLTVVPASGPPARDPKADGRLALNDYSFTFTPELRAGRYTTRVENAGAQAHEVFMVRLLPGKTMTEALEWAKTREGPPPFESAGGTLALSPGAVNFMTTDLVPGEYVLVCFVPDAHDGKPHVAHGMIRQIRVE
jgi:hypothetical protein